MKLEVGKKYLPPLLQICDRCYKVDIYWTIKDDKCIYKECSRCGFNEKVGNVNKENLEKLGYKVK